MAFDFGVHPSTTIAPAGVAASFGGRVMTYASGPRRKIVIGAFSVVLIATYTHERPEGMEEGAVMMTGPDPAGVLDALKVLETQPTGEQRMLQIVSDYRTPNVSEKVVRILHSHVNYVNTFVWHKE
jgi:UDP-N-acetylglucosamine 2-epimerase